jgi:uncharacterized protein YggU (UPF0235/DUF167 family)
MAWYIKNYYKSSMVVSKNILQIKVITKSRGNEIVGWMDGVLKIKVTAVPEKGKANIAVVKLLATVLHIPMSEIQIESGFITGKKKIILGSKHIAMLHYIYKKRNPA